MFTSIFTSSFLFSRLKKANGLQRIYLVVYTLFVVVVIIIIKICEFDVLYGSFCLIKFYILDLVTACKNKFDKQKIPEDRKGNVRRLNEA